MEAKMFDALSDPNRLAIVKLLGGGERCVCDISESLGISDALASHHLKRLREAGLVTTRRHGIWLHCSLDRDAFASIAELLSSFATGHDTPAACCGRPPVDEDVEKGDAGV